MKAQRISKSQCKPQSNHLCCICGDVIKSDVSAGIYIGNYAYPYGQGNNNRCCDYCNCSIVIPTRIEMSFDRVN